MSRMSRREILRRRAQRLAYLMLLARVAGVTLVITVAVIGIASGS